MVRIRSRSVPIKILILLSLWILSSVALPFPMAAGEDPQAAGEITYQPNVIPEVDFYYEDHNFVFQYKNFYIKIRPFVIYQGQYYGLKQIVQWIKAHYPAVSYKYLVEKGLDLIHYGYNLTQIPQEVVDKIDYLGFRLTDHNFPLSWFELEVSEKFSRIDRSSYNRTVISIPKANLELNFDDLYPYGYTVEAVNSTYILIGEVRGRTNLYVDPIIYSTGIITVDGTYTDVFEDIYQADVSGEWGVFDKTGNNAYSQNVVEIDIGDGVNTTTVSDSGCVVNMFGGGGYAFVVKNNATVTFGTLLDAERKSVADGIGFKVDTFDYWKFEEGSTVNLYDCSVVSDGILELDMYGAGNFYHSSFTSGYMMLSFYDTATYDIYNVYSSNDYYEPWNFDDSTSLTIDTIYSFDSDWLFYLVVGGDDMTIWNLYGRGARITTFDTLLGGGKAVYLINADVDSWTFNFLGSGKVFRQYTYDLTVTSPDGVGWEGASVVLSYYGMGGGEVYAGSTASNGSIPTQTLSMGYYDQTGGNSIYDYNPYELNLTDGKYSYLANFTLDREMDQLIALLEPSETYECTWIGTNNTEAGELTLFRSSWEELYDGPGLSHWRCSTNNTGTWVDSSWSSSWADNYWAEYELTLNSTEDLPIAFYFSVNDTNGDVWSSPNCTFTTPLTRTWEGPFFGVTHRVDYGLTLLVVSPPERSPSFLEFLYDKVEIPVELIILNREDRARYFYLSYTVLSESGELLKEGDLSLEIEPKAQQPVSFTFQVPYGKREAPKNFSVSLLADGGEDPIELELTLSHSGLSFIYPLIFLVAIGLIIGVAYIIVKKTKREKPHGP